MGSSVKSTTLRRELFEGVRDALFLVRVCLLFLGVLIFLGVVMYALLFVPSSSDPIKIAICDVVDNKGTPSGCDKVDNGADADDAAAAAAAGAANSGCEANIARARGGPRKM